MQSHRIMSVEIRDNESHIIINMGDHTCTPISSEESSNITKIKYVVLSANIKSTRSIAAALDVTYNRALYMRRRRQLAKQQTTAADYASRQPMIRFKELRQCM